MAHCCILHRQDNQASDGKLAYLGTNISMLMRFRFLPFLMLLIAVASHGQSIKVMTYNLRYDTPVDSVNQWPKRADKVYALIRKYGPDILGVQEAVHHQVMDLIKNLPQYDYIGVGRDDGKTKGEYSAILYKKDRFTVSKKSTFWLSETPDIPGSKSWDAAITRVASWGSMKDERNGKEFMVINTHFDHIGQTARTQSAALLKKEAQALAQNLPVIITGDFNCTREEPPYATMLDPAGLQLFDPAPKTPPGTYCSFAVNSIPCKAIDYIFYTRQWKPYGYKVIQDNDGQYYPSDHLPVMTSFLFQR